MFFSWGGALFNVVSAGNPQNIPLQIINGSAAGNQSTKAPLRPLVITQDDYILTFPAQGNDHMLVFRDDTGTVVYTTFVPAGSTQIVLPSTLSGDFEIRLVADAYYYIGFIVL